MSQLHWDFSKSGLFPAVKEFVWSLLKTVLVAAVTYVGFRLENIHITSTPETAQIYLAVVAGLRALVSFAKVWLNTIPGKAPEVQG